MSSQGLMSGGGKNYGSTQSDYGQNDNNPIVSFAGPSTSAIAPGFFDAPQFYRLCDDITSKIYSVEKNVNKTQKWFEKMSNQTITDTTAQLKQLRSLIQHQPPGSGKEEKMRVTRLTTDFGASVKRYTDLRKQIVAKMKTAFLPPTRVSIGAADDDDQGNLIGSDIAQHQLVQQELETLEFEQGMLLEREERIRQIECDIVDVNEIMKELGSMVHEQGGFVETIEQNIEGAYNEVDAGRQELQKAASYQTKYRRRMFCLLGTGLIILIIVVIVLVTQLKS